MRLTPPHAGDRRRQLDVLAGAEAGQEVEELEDEAEVCGPEPGPLSFAEAADLAAVEAQPSLARGVEGAEQVQQRALAAARGADDRDQLAGLDPHRDPVQNLHCAGAERIALANPVQLQDGAGVTPLLELPTVLAIQPTLPQLLTAFSISDAGHIERLCETVLL